MDGAAVSVPARAASKFAAIWAGAMMLDHLGHSDAADMLMAAVNGVTAAGSTLTPDLGGSATTHQVGEAIRHQIVGMTR